MKLRALTKRSKCKSYTKDGRKNVTSDQGTTKCDLRLAPNLQLFGNFSKQYWSKMCADFLKQSSVTLLSVKKSTTW